MCSSLCTQFEEGEFHASKCVMRADAQRCTALLMHSLSMKMMEDFLMDLEAVKKVKICVGVFYFAAAFTTALTLLRPVMHGIRLRHTYRSTPRAALKQRVLYLL